MAMAMASSSSLWTLLLAEQNYSTKKGKVRRQTQMQENAKTQITTSCLFSSKFFAQFQSLSVFSSFPTWTMLFGNFLGCVVCICFISLWVSVLFAVIFDFTFFPFFYRVTNFSAASLLGCNFSLGFKMHYAACSWLFNFWGTKFRVNFVGTAVWWLRKGEKEREITAMRLFRGLDWW